MKAKYSKITGGIYPVSAFKTFPDDALDIPDVLYAKFKNAEISGFDVVNGNVVEFVPTPPSIEQQLNAIKSALQREIDSKAVELGFSSGNSLMLYAGFTNPFQSLAQTFAMWEASVWAEADTYRNEVLAGNAQIPTIEEAIAMMPAYPL